MNYTTPLLSLNTLQDGESNPPLCKQQYDERPEADTPSTRERHLLPVTFSVCQYITG
ncbi:hypothetical protein J6590_059037 [Homalodisca vitripennis]|nr:hypothetical protein J6590_059037 [Homalodisca vitripennis]